MASDSTLRVLLVEDNDFTRSTVAGSLAAIGIDVVGSVSTTRAAMEVAHDHVIDCAIIDLHLGPGPSGLDLAHGLRKNDRSVGVVILTSYEDPRLLSSDQRPLPPGAVYLVKNDIHSTEQLREAVEQACGLREAPPTTAGDRVHLTNTQVELLRMVADGLTNAEIARRRFISERAVETSLSRIAHRLGIEQDPAVNTRVRLVQSYLAMIGGSGAR